MYNDNDTLQSAVTKEKKPGACLSIRLYLVNRDS